MSHHLHHVDFRKLSRFEMFVVLIGSVEPFVAIPQVLKIFRLQSAHEFFIWRSVFGFCTAIVFIIYGIKIRKAPIIIASSLWFIVHGSMTVAILIYG